MAQVRRDTRRSGPTGTRETLQVIWLLANVLLALWVLSRFVLAVLNYGANIVFAVVAVAAVVGIVASATLLVAVWRRTPMADESDARRRRTLWALSTVGFGACVLYPVAVAALVQTL